jgi:Transposase and inactivated derivatives
MPRLGGRKLYYLLKDDFDKESIKIGRDKLFDLLRVENLLVSKKKKYIKTTDSSHWRFKYPDQVKGVQPTGPEQIWVADITYLALIKGYCYLHLITDAYSKKIMGYKISDNLAAIHTIEALKQAIQQRQYKRKLIHHSDRGLQYCSTGYVTILKQNGIKISMTQDGSPYDNAIAERVNGILKDEFELDDVFEDQKQAESLTRQAITLYNQYRPHMSCSMLTPNKMHQQTKLKAKNWRQVLS